MAIFTLKTHQGVIGDFSLRDLEGFPYLTYQSNKQRYERLWRWYTGEALETVPKGKNDGIEDFPARVNPIRTAAQKHVGALFGEFVDGGDSPPVRIRVKALDEKDQKRAEHVERVLQMVFAENNAGPAMIENGLLSQIYGGCVFRLGWDKDDKTLKTGVRMDAISAPYFIGIPDGNNFWKLREAWIVQQITAEEALRYRVKVPHDFAWYIEHWTPEEYSVQINNILVGDMTSGTEAAFGGANPYGFVPFVYIPHIRVGSFYGESMITEAVMGLMREYNKNVADAGDAVKAAANAYVWFRNTRGVPSVVGLAEGLDGINLGSAAPSISGSTSDPDIGALKMGDISAPMVDLVDKVAHMLGRELFTPDVSYGEFGGGSQRSSSSLHTMMWHLTSHTKLERMWWTAGLRTLAKMAILILAKQGMFDLTEEDANFEISIHWYEHLPRDREELINELSVRAANNIGSLRHLLELSGDVDDAKAMVEEIKEWMKFVASLKPPAASGSQSTSAPQARQTAPSSRTPKRN